MSDTFCDISFCRSSGADDSDKLCVTLLSDCQSGFSPQTTLFAYNTATLRTGSAAYNDDFTPEKGVLSPKNACFSSLCAEITRG